MVLFCAYLALGSAYAADGDYEVEATFGVDTAGVFRGQKSTTLNPAVSATVTVERGDFFGGMFVTPSKIADEVRPFVLGYLGYGSSVKEVDWSVSARYYSFPDSSPFVIDLDKDGNPENVGEKGFFEAVARAGFSIGAMDISAGAFYSPNGFGDTGGALYTTGSVKTEIGWDVTLRGNVGVSRFENDLYNDDYIDYAVGVYREVFGIDMFLRYSNTSGRAGSGDSVVVFGVEKAWSVASSGKAHERRNRKIRNDLVFEKTFIRGAN